MDIWHNEIASLRAEKPFLSDEEIDRAVRAASAAVEERTGIAVNTNAPMLIQAAGFLLVMIQLERDREREYILRCNFRALIEPYCGRK